MTQPSKNDNISEISDKQILSRLINAQISAIFMLINESNKSTGLSLRQSVNFIMTSRTSKTYIALNKRSGNLTVLCVNSFISRQKFV